MATLTLSLVSHTNAGKTTLARTLLWRDIGQVRDAPHVTEFAESHDLIETPEGDRLRLWDTPGFGDSARLVRRLRAREQPLGWLLSQVWDRWRERPFWASQQALRHVQAESDVVLYLVNAAESPASAGYVAPEMELLAWLGKPVLVLLNQLGAPRAAPEEAAEVQAWREHLARWPFVRAVLPLDAFARCWVHEHTLLRAVQDLLPAERADAMARLTAAWLAQREATFDAAMHTLAQSLARTAALREPVAPAAGLGERLRQLGATLARSAGGSSGDGSGEDGDPAAAAQHRLVQAAQAEARESTAQLVALHGLQGRVEDEIIGRVQAQFAVRERVPEGRAAILGGALTGALTGLKADLLSGGLTLGGGLLAGGLLGALGAAGLARGINVLRDTGRSWVAFSDEAMAPLVQAALLRYLAVAHFGRGRGDWVQGEAPPHWPAAVAQALAPHAPALAALWAARSPRFENPGEDQTLATALQPLLQDAARTVFERLYPGGLLGR
ncbi:MAG: GTPase domain-containing protein [Rubrivivax sp.]|nr:GTPase domain-containing protein [Rubrivivax sp.]